MTFKHDHEICDHIQCPECLNIAMPLRKALIKILSYGAKWADENPIKSSLPIPLPCMHQFGHIHYSNGIKTCVQCGMNLND